MFHDIKRKFSVDKYYIMTDAQLEHEASKYHIQEYGYPSGGISRERIIKQLLEKDGANNSRISLFISIIAILISIISLIISIK